MVWLCFEALLATLHKDVSVHFCHGMGKSVRRVLFVNRVYRGLDSLVAIIPSTLPLYSYPRG